MNRTTPLRRAKRLPNFCMWWWLLPLLLLSACTLPDQPAEPTLTLPADLYFDKVHGAWQATLAANHTGLLHEGKYLAEPGPANSIELVLPEQWSTDDDTAVEWVALHILETDGLDPTYAQIRAQWVDHLNHDIWVSTRRARDLPEYQTVPEIAARTQALAEKVIRQAGGRVEGDVYFVPASE